MRFTPTSWKGPELEKIVVEQDEHHLKAYKKQINDRHYQRYGEYDYELIQMENNNDNYK